MTRALVHCYYRHFTNDPDIFLDSQPFVPYQYSVEHCDAYWEKQRSRNRVHLAVMLEDRPIGEILLKHIDKENRTCTLSIHLQNDAVKNKGYGTSAEKLALEYSVKVLGMKTVLADALIKNKRSQHVLEKVGFHFVRKDEMFCYYQYQKAPEAGPEVCEGA